MRFLIFFLAGLWVAGPGAAQPFSQSMAQCAGLYEGVEPLVSSPDRKAKLIAAAAAFSDAAVDQARGEGEADPEAWVAGHREAMRADWEARGASAVFSQEFRDWTAYCVKFARSNGIDLTLD